MVSTRTRNYDAMALGRNRRKQKAQKPKPSSTKNGTNLKTIVKGKTGVRKGKVVMQRGPDRLTALPAHVTVNILKYLSPKDVQHCALTCRRLSAVTSDNQLWKEIWEGIVHREPTLDTQYRQPQAGPLYKSVCKQITVIQSKWRSGEGVKTFTKKRLTAKTRKNFDRNRYCMVISSRYILTIDAPPSNVHNIYVFSAVKGTYSHMLRGLTSRANEVVLSKDEKMVAAHCWGGTVVHVWKVETGELQHSFDHPDYVWTIAMHGEMLAVSFYGGVSVWNVQSGQHMYQFIGLEANLRFDVLLNGQHMAVYAKGNQVLRLFDVKMGHVLFTWSHTTYFWKLLLDSGTQSLLCLQADAIGVYDTETGTLRATVTATGTFDYDDMLLHDDKLILHSNHTRHAIVVR